MSLPVKGVGAMSADECIVAIALRAEQASSTASSLFVFFICSPLGVMTMI